MKPEKQRKETPAPGAAAAMPPSRAPLLWAAAILGFLALGQAVALSVALGPRVKSAAQAAAEAWSRGGAPTGGESAAANPPPVSIPPPETIEAEIIQEQTGSAPPSAPPRVANETSPQEFILRTSLEAVLVARSARKRGDMQMALDKLREAQALAPDNPEVLAEIAATFEQMGLFDKAIAHWRMVYQLGPRGGIYYRMATEKITRGVGKAAGLPDEGAGVQQAEGLVKAREASKLLIESAETEKIETGEEGPPSITLRLIFRAQERPLSVRETKVQVFFYDIIDDQKIELTNADTTSEWTTKPIDWVNGAPEELRVTYIPSSTGPDAENSQVRRKYLGYIVRVYYRNQLQDVAAEPKRLLDLFPPPNTLTDELPETDPAGG